MFQDPRVSDLQYKMHLEEEKYCGDGLLAAHRLQSLLARLRFHVQIVVEYSPVFNHKVNL